MIKNIIVLPDGTEISSGAGYAIKQSSSYREVNDGVELLLGAVCANKVSYTIYDVGGTLALGAGDEITLYREQNGVRIKKGVYRLEKPTRPTANTMRITGYDRVIKLDKDLTDWVNSLTGWPYNILTFARMVCEECGLTFVTTEAPNMGFMVHQFAKTGATGRKIMRWLAEICCRFCRANDDGEIEFAWYTPSGVTIRPTGDRWYFQGGLTFEAYKVAPVEAAQIRLADSSAGALWPTVESGLNSYIIDGNAIVNARITEDMADYLDVIKANLANVTYTPCKLSIPACLDIDAGNTVDIVDKNGVKITAYVMSKATSGQTDTVSCTGSPRRDSPEATNTRTQSSDQAFADAFAGLSHEQIYNKWSDNGKIQGIYAYNGVWYVNAEVAQITNLKVGRESLPGDVPRTSDIPENLSQLLNDTGYLNETGVVTIVNGTVTADYVNALALKVKAANIEGVLAIGQLPEDLALTTDIPENLSQLLNDTGYVDTTGVVTIVNGTVTADFVNALALKVKAANIEGVLAIGQLPDNVAVTSEIPTSLSQLLNDSGYQTQSGVVTIVNGTVTADYVNALALKVKAANIEGTLAVGQLPDGVAFETQIPANLSQLVNDSGYQTSSGVVAIVNGTVTADYVNALALKVAAANITGTLAVGQLPDEVALSTEIPKNLSDLINDSGYLSETGVVAIVNGTVTADYVNALGVTAKYLLVNDASGNKLFQAGDNAVEMAGWTVNNAAFTSGTFGDTYFIGLYSKYSNTDLTIGSVTSNRWRIIAGKSFGVTSDGKLAAADATISGKVTATSGAIGGWTIGDTLTATTVRTAVGVKHTQTVTLTTDGVTVESTWADDENSTLTPTVPSYITLGKKYTKYVTWAELLKVWE